MTSVLENLSEKNDPEEPHTHLSKRDLAVLRKIMQTNGQMSALNMAKALGIPYSTVHRKRLYLEAHFVRHIVSLNLKAFKLKEVEIDIAVMNGSAVRVMSILERIPCVIKIVRGLGTKGTDIRITCVIKEQHELLSLCDKMKVIEGVSNIGVFEVAEEYRPNNILDLALPQANLLTVSDLEDVEQ